MSGGTFYGIPFTTYQDEDGIWHTDMPLKGVTIVAQGATRVAAIAGMKAALSNIEITTPGHEFSIPMDLSEWPPHMDDQGDDERQDG